MLIGFFILFFLFDIFFIFASCFEPFSVVLSRTYWQKAFSGRFGFDGVRTSQLQTDCQKQSSGNAPWNVYILVYIHSAWGFQRCSFRQSGQREGLYTVERVTELAPRLFFSSFMVEGAEPTLLKGS